MSQYEQTFSHHDVYVGWSKGLQGHWTRRYVSGFAYDSHVFGPAPDSLYPDASIPTDRKFVYPFVGIELLQNEYVTHETSTK